MATPTPVEPPPTTRMSHGPGWAWKRRYISERVISFHDSQRNLRHNEWPMGRGGRMFASGNVTVYVSNMDAAVRFYSETLGLKLAYRFGDHWAAVEVGKGLTIGLHPASVEMPAGRKGSMTIGLELSGSIHDAV